MRSRTETILSVQFYLRLKRDLRIKTQSKQGNEEKRTCRDYENEIKPTAKRFNIVAWGQCGESFTPGCWFGIRLNSVSIPHPAHQRCVPRLQRGCVLCNGNLE